VLVLVWLLLVPASPSVAWGQATARSPVARLRFEAERVAGLVESGSTRAFLEATTALPEPSERVVLYDEGTREAVTAEEHVALAPELRTRFKPTPFGPEFYYSTRYGSPLAYVRLLEVVAQPAGLADGDALAGKRILDFGYGGIGHLRLLASLGCEVVGVEVDSLLRVYYGPADQGEVPSAGGGRAGRLALVHGRWPADEDVKRAVGGGFDLVLAKNVLKKGYVRPAQYVDPRQLVDLGVPAESFLPEVARILAPGGWFVIYNLCPAPQRERYIPWAYGESPFTRAEYEAAGLELVAFDMDDSAAARELGYALSWEEQGMDLEGDLFAWYTLARRRP
jgi:SAM-dependent methyltransferase